MIHLESNLARFDRFEFKPILINAHLTKTVAHAAVTINRSKQSVFISSGLPVVRLSHSLAVQPLEVVSGLHRWRLVVRRRGRRRRGGQACARGAAQERPLVVFRRTLIVLRVRASAVAASYTLEMRLEECCIPGTIHIELFQRPC